MLPQLVLEGQTIGSILYFYQYTMKVIKRKSKGKLKEFIDNLDINSESYIKTRDEMLAIAKEEDLKISNNDPNEE